MVSGRVSNFHALRSYSSPILKCLQVYHNLAKPHDALDGQTPAEKAGIEVQALNKWRTPILNASYSKEANNPIA
jgi:hypothetical protein